jgi:hypothetical protein
MVDTAGRLIGVGLLALIVVPIIWSIRKRRTGIS